jgi:predicted nucleic acid-binding protein
VTVLVDTSAWVEYLRGTGSPHSIWIRGAIRAETPLGWTDPVLYELTAGARSARRAEELRALLLRGPMLAVVGLQDWEEAAKLYRSARSKGLTIRSSIDCLIAAVGSERAALCSHWTGTSTPSPRCPTSSSITHSRDEL